MIEKSLIAASSTFPVSVSSYHSKLSSYQNSDVMLKHVYTSNGRKRKLFGPQGNMWPLDSSGNKAEKCNLSLNNVPYSRANPINTNLKHSNFCRCS